MAEITKVTDVVWQAGSTGSLTPVVEFEPTLIDGSIVRRASIHNYDIFKEWDFAIGDTIEVQKNNDIIPQVKSVVERSNNTKFEAPTHCPVCDSELSLITINTTNLVCTNPLCKAKFVGSVKKWATKSGMTSKGVGDAFFNEYAEKYNTVEELYSLTIEDIKAISPRYKDKSASVIYNAIQSSKSMKLMDFFGGLNIYGAGSRTFKKLIDYFNVNDVDSLCDSIDVSNLSVIDGIGAITAEYIQQGTKSLRDRISALKSVVSITPVEATSSDGKSFLFTGAINTIDPSTGKGYKRSVLEDMVMSKGHKVASSVSKELNYLVTSDSDSTSSKMVKAKKLGVNIIGEDEFFKMMAE